MPNPKSGRKQPEIVVNGTRVDALDPRLETSGVDPNLTASVSFQIGNGGPAPLYFIGSQVSLKIGEYGPAHFRVVGIEEIDIGERMLYQIVLRQVMPSQDTVNLLYGSVFHTIMNRLQLHALMSLLEAKGVISTVEYNAKMSEAADQMLIPFASEIVSSADAEAMRNYVVASFQQRNQSQAEETSPSTQSPDDQ